MALPEGALPLIVGTLLALGALALVLWPLVSDSSGEPRRNPEPASDADKYEAASSPSVIALREIEFDRATGKLSDADYDDLRQRYTRQAIEEMRQHRAGLPAEAGAEGSAEASAEARAGFSVGTLKQDAGSDDAVEAAIRRARARGPICPTCGPQKEPDAVYCSNCGRYLPGTCGSCGEPVNAPGARFCSGCGSSLAA